MKKTLMIALVALAVYTVSYIYVRATHYGTITYSVADATGGFHPDRHKAVCFLEPASGFQRHTTLILYRFFYPMGKLDHLLTGRLYQLADMRDAADAETKH